MNFAELQSQYAEVRYQSDLSDLWLRVANAWIELVGAGQLVVAYQKPLIPLLAAAKQEIAKLNQGDGIETFIGKRKNTFRNNLKLFFRIGIVLSSEIDLPR